MSAARVPAFFWYELMSPDVPASVAFYRRVIGWETAEMAGGVPYTVLSAQGAGIGGVMALTPEMIAGGARPGWVGYVGVDDVDGTVARITAAGGKVFRPPGDIPGVGRFAVVGDPYGAVFMLLKGSSPEGPKKLAPETPGGIGWHELHAGDGPGAWKFYSGVFGWTADQAMDMGPMGVYQTFKMDAAPTGGIMTRMPETPGPFWLFYFTVDGLDAAIARATELGGKVIHGPIEVPGGSHIVNMIDPQGVFFAMVAARR